MQFNKGLLKSKKYEDPPFFTHPIVTLERLDFSRVFVPLLFVDNAHV